jgi:hypothetical protein
MASKRPQENDDCLLPPAKKQTNPELLPLDTEYFNVNEFGNPDIFGEWPSKYWTECPCNFDKTYTGEHIGEPILDYSGQIIGHVVPVPISSEEINEIISTFRQENLVVKSVKRIQNNFLMKRFNHILETEGPIVITSIGLENNIKTLYHYSRSEAKQLYQEGLDHRLSKGGMFGKGIYFAANPIKANSYCFKPIQQDRTIFVSSVLTGKMKKYNDGEQDTTLLREPVGFNSVVGNITGDIEHVIYDMNRTILQYEITYTCTTNIMLTHIYNSRRFCWKLKHPDAEYPINIQTIDKYKEYVKQVLFNRIPDPQLVSLIKQILPPLPLPPLPLPPLPLPLLPPSLLPPNTSTTSNGIFVRIIKK